MSTPARSTERTARMPFGETRDAEGAAALVPGCARALIPERLARRVVA